LEIKNYTKEEFEALEKNAREVFKQEADLNIKNYSEYLETLTTKKFERGKMSRSAFVKKQELFYKLNDFIIEHYPNEKEIFINGNCFYTIGAKIHFSLMVEELRLFDDKLQEMYLDFHSKIFPEYID